MSLWIQNAIGLGPEDASLAGGLERVNIPLNRKRLAAFLQTFADDSDVRDFLFLDLLGFATGTEINSTGELGDALSLSARPFRLWEYIWLYKGLNLAKGGYRILDLGGPASHLLVMAALAGSEVWSIDINPAIVGAGRHGAAKLGLKNYHADTADMRDLQMFAPASFDRILSCSVLEHLTGPDQQRALSEMARVLAPGGRIGLTFDYGAGAPGANQHLPPPHDPPGSPDEIRARYVHSGLEVLGNSDLEKAVPGSLFHSDAVSYTVASLFLGKSPVRDHAPEITLSSADSLLSRIKILDLPGTLYSWANQERSRMAEYQVLKDAARERLEALEAAHVEMRMLHDELHRRGAALFETTAQLAGRGQQGGPGE